MAASPLPEAVQDGPFLRPPGPGASFSLRDGTLVVERLTVADPGVVGAAKRARAAGGPPGLETWARSAFCVGAVAIANAGANAGLDELGGKLSRLGETAARAAAASAEQVRAAVERATDPAGGTVAVSVGQALRGLEQRIDGLLVAEDAPLRAAVAKAVRAATEEAASRVERSLAANTDAVRRSLSDPAGPVGQLRSEVAQQAESTRADLARLNEMIAAAGAARKVMARTAVKGATFEQDAVEATVDCLAPGDTLDATGSASGAAGGRKGDAVVTVDPSAAGGLPGVRVVVECKDSPLSPAALLRELRLAATNRQAQAGVAVVRAGRMPGSAGVLVLSARPFLAAVAYEPGGDTSLLRAVLHLARAGAAEQALGDAFPDVDRTALSAAVRQAAEALGEWHRIDRAVAATRRAVDETARAADHVRDRVGTSLGTVARLLGPPGSAHAK